MSQKDWLRVLLPRVHDEVLVRPRFLAQTALGPIQPPIHWVVSALSPGNAADAKNTRVAVYIHPHTSSWHNA
jgi:hypothetical protein